jgi:glycosyltransferase involved in cell wall biosynthesis
MEKVSVIIPTYNRKLWLQQAIDSVLAQTYPNVEVIVIDDGSTDGTREALLPHYGEQIRYVYQDNQGESHARNHGIALAQGEYLAFLDSDDLWLPEKLAQQVGYLNLHPLSGAVFCLAWSIDENGQRNPRFPYGSHFRSGGFNAERILQDRYSLGINSTILMRKTAFERTGGFDDRIIYGEDLDFCLRLFLNECQPGLIKQPLASIRTHGASQSLTLNADKVERVLKDHLAIFDKVLAASQSDSLCTAAHRARLKEYFRAYGYYLLSGQDGKVSETVARIKHEYPHGLGDAALYDYVIDYYIPLVFLSQHDRQQTVAFVQSVLKERKKHAGPDTLSERLAVIRAYVWCALRGHRKDYLSALNFLVSSVWMEPRLLGKGQYYLWALKLLFGRWATPILQLRLRLAYRPPQYAVSK